MFEIREKPDQVERALIIGLCFSQEEYVEAGILLDELEELVTTLGIAIVGKQLVRSRDIHAKFLCGTGKAEELRDLAVELEADCVVFDNMLAPSQQREWERLMNLTVIDREEVILDIFAKRAKTKEAALQVELARMNYSLPRMTKMWGHLDRQGGGSGGGKGGSGAARGEGETQLEVDRRLARNRIEQLEKELSDVRKQRATQRKERERQNVPHASIVGYTNSGKSSLLNLLSGADIMAKDMLFATLDTTTRKITLPHGQELLLTDTVGFIRNLPHRLVEAFKSTLEEAVIAHFLIQVVDCSSPDARDYYDTTLKVLEELGAHDKQMITVLNKIDLLPEENREEILSGLEEYIKGTCIRMSVKDDVGGDDLFKACEKLLSERVREASFRIPQARADLIALMYRDGKVFDVQYEDNDVIVTAQIPVLLYNHLINWEVTPSQS